MRREGEQLGALEALMLGHVGECNFPARLVKRVRGALVLTGGPQCAALAEAFLYSVMLCWSLVHVT
jgi:hypothetical protein